MSNHPHSLAHNPNGGRYFVAGQWQHDRPEDAAEIQALWVGNVLAEDLTTAIHQGQLEICLGTHYGSLKLVPTVRRQFVAVEEPIPNPTPGTASFSNESLAECQNGT